MSIISSIFRTLLGQSPSVSNTAVTQTQQSEKAALSARASLYETQGGSTGQELTQNQVQRRQTLFGN